MFLPLNRNAPNLFYVTYSLCVCCKVFLAGVDSRRDKTLPYHFDLYSMGHFHFMHLSKRAEYAIRVMIHLGVARELGLPAVPGPMLANADHLPLKFIERILQDLRDAGLVETKRGKQGGYLIKKAPEEVKIGDLVRHIDGRLAPISCASENAYERCSCPDEEHCGLRMLMIDVRNAIARILDHYTLGDVVEVTLRKLRRDGITHPLAQLGEPIKSCTSGKGKANPADGFLAGLTEFVGENGTRKSRKCDKQG